MDVKDEIRLQMTRRHLFGIAARGVGVAALASLLSPLRALGETESKAGGLPGLPHFKPRAKRVIFLFQLGAPSQVDLFDFKPGLKKLHGTEMPTSVRQGPALQGGGVLTLANYTLAAPIAGFQQVGQSGAWISELLPHHAKIMDEIAIIRSVQSDTANHDAGVTFFQTGSLLAGRPSMGAWLTYGLGSENQNMPGFVVLNSKPAGMLGDIGLASRYWGTGFMSSKFQGVPLSPGAEPVAYLSNPSGVDRAVERGMLDDLNTLNHMSYEAYRDPEIQTRIAQYEMAYRLQAALPQLTDLSKEPDSVFELYGPDSRTPGTYAANCLLARRLAERDVRFIQLYNRGWDQHNYLPRDLRAQCKATDQASAALIQDLKQRGLLEDTLVVWAGEFGRTVYSQMTITVDNFGRDHHGKCFTVWMAGGGIKPGIAYGETDDFSYNVVRDAVSVHDLQATMLHCLGIDHTKLTYRFQGRYFRLTDVSGEVINKILI